MSALTLSGHVGTSNDEFDNHDEGEEDGGEEEDDDDDDNDDDKDDECEGTRFYKDRYFSLKLKCQQIQERNEAVLRRVSAVRKLVRRLHRQNKCLSMRLSKHDRRWRETSRFTPDRALTSRSRGGGNVVDDSGQGSDVGLTNVPITTQMVVASTSPFTLAPTTSITSSLPSVSLETRSASRPRAASFTNAVTSQTLVQIDSGSRIDTANATLTPLFSTAPPNSPHQHYQPSSTTAAQLFPSTGLSVPLSSSLPIQLSQLSSFSSPTIPASLFSSLSTSLLSTSSPSSSILPPTISSLLPSPAARTGLKFADFKTQRMNHRPMTVVPSSPSAPETSIAAVAAPSSGFPQKISTLDLPISLPSHVPKNPSISDS